MLVGRASCVSIVLLLTLGVASPTLAQSLVQRSFDFELHGDDPGQVFPFSLAPDPLRPVIVGFEGYFQNLVGAETGVRYDLWWTTADGNRSEGYVGTDFTRLPGSGQLPVTFEHAIGFTPATVYFHIEGGGPDDHFQLAGEFTIQQVPEPGVLAMLGTAAVFGLIRKRLRRTSAIRKKPSQL